MERHIPEKGNLLERIKWQGLSYFAIALVAYGCSHNKQEREGGVTYKGTEIIREDMDAMVRDKKVGTLTVSFSIGDSDAQSHNEIIKAPDKLLQITKKLFGKQNERLVYHDVDGNNKLDGDDTYTILIGDNGKEWKITHFEVKAKTEKHDMSSRFPAVIGKGSIIGGNKARKALVVANESYKLWLNLIFDSFDKRNNSSQDKNRI